MQDAEHVETMGGARQKSRLLELIVEKLPGCQDKGATDADRMGQQSTANSNAEPGPWEILRRGLAQAAPVMRALRVLLL